MHARVSVRPSVRVCVRHARGRIAGSNQEKMRAERKKKKWEKKRKKGNRAREAVEESERRRRRKRKRKECGQDKRVNAEARKRMTGCENLPGSHT